MENIEEALKNGYGFKAFLSGGRLRVLRLDLDKEKKSFYGESINFREALRILKDDIKAGGREYKKVYGPIETPYWTGSNADTDIDALMFSGDIEAGFDDEAGMIKVCLKIHVRNETPKEIINRVSKELVAIRWSSFDGRTVHEFLSYPMQFANHEFGCSTKVLSDSEYNSIQKKEFYGFSDTFEAALEMAIFEQKTMTDPEIQILEVDENYAIKKGIESYVRKEQNSESIEG